MVDNAPVKTLHFKGLTIEGYSRAAVQTYWRIPELKIGFDLGAQPWSFMGTDTWFVIALPSGSHRRAAGVRGPTAADEDDAADDLSAGERRSNRWSEFLRLFTRLDGGRLPCRFVRHQAGR